MTAAMTAPRPRLAPRSELLPLPAAELGRLADEVAAVSVRAGRVSGRRGERVGAVDVDLGGVSGRQMT